MTSSSPKFDILIHSKDECKYCKLSKEYLDERGIEYKVENHLDKNERLDFLEELTLDAKRGDPPTNTFPQIFIDGKRIGGYNELQTFFSFNGNDDF